MKKTVNCERKYIIFLLGLCGLLSAHAANARTEPADVEALTKLLTVRAEPRDMKILPNLGRLEQPSGSRPYAVLQAPNGVFWSWQPEQFLAGVNYELVVEFGNVGSLAETTGRGLKLSVWNSSADPAGSFDEMGRRLSVELGRGELRAIGDGVSEAVVGVFQPAEFEGHAFVNFQSFVPKEIIEQGGSFPRIYQFRFRPVLENKDPTELQEILRRQRVVDEAVSVPSAGAGVELSEQWTVFGPFTGEVDWPTLVQADFVPERLEINGSTFEARVFGSKWNRIDLREAMGDFPMETEALVFIPLTVKNAGPVSFGFGADWWFAAYLDGTLLKETFSGNRGNVAWPPKPSNHMASRWLEAGNHLLAIRFMAGRGSAILSVAGPVELSKLGPNDWVPVKEEAVEQAGPEMIPGGDFEFKETAFPQSWRFDGEELEADSEALRLVSDLSFTGKQSLLIDTTAIDRGTQKIIIPLQADLKQLYRFQAAVQYIDGDGYLSMIVQDDMDTGNSELMLGVGKDLSLYQPSEEMGGFELITGYTFFNVPELYLVIRTHGSIKVRLDDISIRAVSDSLQFTGATLQRHPWSRDWFDLEMSSKVVTPHTEWAKPLEGGSLRVAGLMPYWEGRNLVEIGQRISLESIFLPFQGPNEWISDWWMRDEGDEPAIFRSREWILKTIAEEPMDAFLLWEISASTLDDQTVTELLARVESGAGLVITGFNQPYWPKPDGERAQALAAFQSGVWAKALNPANAIEGQADADSATWSARAGIEFYRHGAGRIALISSYGAIIEDPESMDVFEGKMSILAKALQWSAGRAPQVRLSGIEVNGVTRNSEVVSITEGAELGWVLNNAPQANLELQWWVQRERNGPKLSAGSQQLVRGEMRASWSDGLSSLPGGYTYLGVQLLKDGRIIDWAQYQVARNTTTKIADIRIDGLDPYLTEDDRVRGTIRVSGELAPETELTVLLEDLDGNLWGIETGRPEPEEGKMAFDFGQQTARNQVHRLTVKLSDVSGLELDCRTEEFSIVRNASFYDTFFEHQIWQLPGTYLGGLAARQLRKLGVSSAYWAKPSTRGVALANIRGIPSLAQNFPPKLRVAGDLEEAPEMAIPLASPGRVHQMQERVDMEMAEMDGGKWAPLAYGQGHESNMRGFGIRSKQDVCFAPASLNSFRRFAEDEYESLTELNDAWGTTFGNWQDVEPIVLDQALKATEKSGSLARWIQHRRHMDRVYLNYMTAKRDAARKFIPGIEATHDNFYGTDSFSGVDLWLQLNQLVAGAGIGGGVLQSFTPPERKHLVLKRNAIWHPIMITEDDELMAVRFGLTPWHHLMEGYHGSTYWTGHFTGTRFPNSNFGMPLLADFRFAPMGPWIGDEIERIREGVDKIVFDSRADDSGIAILYSRESEHAATAWQGLNFRDEVAQTIWPESEAGSLGALLQNEGFQYRRISNAQILQGGLSDGYIRLLILPFSQAISIEVAELIEKFVANGGMVIADIRPGVMNTRGELHPFGVLDEIFGVRQDVRWEAFRLTEATVDLREFSEGRASSDSDRFSLLVGSGVNEKPSEFTDSTRPPVFLENKYGSGGGLLVNVPFSRLSPAAEAHFLNLLAGYGFEPPFGVEEVNPKSANSGGAPELIGDEDLIADPDGFMGDVDAMMNPMRFRHFFGSIEIIGLSSHRQHKGSGTIKYRIEWPREGYVYDLMDGRFMGKQTGSEIEMAREGISVFALVPYEIKAPGLEVSVDREPDGRIRLRATAELQEEASSQSHVIQLVVLKPDGTDWFELPESSYARSGEAHFDVLLPVNAPIGEWKLIAREAISRLESSVTVDISASPAPGSHQ